eukprot:3228042-Amphidinium_carterae.1
MTFQFRNYSVQSEKRLEQVTAMDQTTIVQLQQKLLDLEMLMTPKVKIDTPDFVAVSLSASMPP